MSSNSPNANIPETVFVHRDYEKIVGIPSNFINRERQVIKDKLEKSDDGGDQIFEFFDLSRHIKELEKTNNIYFTDESGKIIGYLSEEPDEIIKNKIYGKIGEAICDEYLTAPKGDFEETMSDIALGLTEIELVTRNGFVAGIRLGEEYEETDEDDGDEIESDKEKNLPN